MRKIIISRFPGKCKVCTKGIAAGDRVYWLGKGKGLQHLSCSDSKPDQAVTKSEKAHHSYVTKFTDVRDRFRQISSGDFSGIRNVQANLEIAEYLRESVWIRQAYWVGCSVAEMNDWLSHGFIVDGLAGVESLFPAKPRRRIRFHEEGDEMLIDLAWSGIDNHFIDWDKRMVKPGLIVDIACTFESGFDAEIIVMYQRWIARMLQSLDEAAVDCEINITNRVKNVFKNSQDGHISDTSIRVKESGEASDFAAWSAMFSPGGFRQLMFTAMLFGADETGMSITKGLGTPMYANDWTVAYNEETNTLSIANAGTSRTFPEYEMTEKFKAVLDTINGG